MFGTVGRAHGRIEQPVEVVDFGNRPHRRTGIGRNGLLIDGNRRGKSADFVDLGIVVNGRHDHSRVGRKAFEIPPLAFRVDGIEREGRFSRSRNPRHGDELVLGDFHPHVFQVVRFGTDDLEEFGHGIFGEKRFFDREPRAIES